jgi:ribosome-associated toxin RatA of RatAB toxin-antitoxin module
MKEIVINQASRMEIEYDITNGLFSTTYEANNKCYYDAENDLDIEVQSEYKHLIGAWQFDVTVTDRNGDEYMLEEGQWEKLYKALMGDVEWREKEARSEAEHIKQLWRSAYA